jgi:hypothetical protein
MAAAPFVVSKAVPPALGIVGATALAAYMLGYALVPTLLFLSEIWAGIIAVLVLAAFAQVRDEGDQRRWMILAAALALLAAMTRELMVFLLVAGVIASVFGPKHQRRFSTILWSGTLLAFFAYWGVSAFLARAIITPIPGGGFVWLAHGGLANLRSGIIASTWNIGGKWIPILLAVLGVAGAFAQPEKRYRIFAVAVVLMPLVGFLFAGSDAVGGGPARLPFNYWGGIVGGARGARGPPAQSWCPRCSRWHQRPLHGYRGCARPV